MTTIEEVKTRINMLYDIEAHMVFYGTTALELLRTRLGMNMWGIYLKRINKFDRELGQLVTDGKNYAMRYYRFYAKKHPLLPQFCDWLKDRSGKPIKTTNLQLVGIISFSPILLKHEEKGGKYFPNTMEYIKEMIKQKNITPALRALIKLSEEYDPIGCDPQTDINCLFSNIETMLRKYWHQVNEHIGDY